jgi:hypothetical protein
VLYGLTFRQLAILAVAAVIFYGGWQALHRMVPAPVLLGAAVVLGGLVFGLAVGRRDGLPMDLWLLYVVRHSRAPRALSTTDTTAKTPDWVQAPASTVMLPAPLKLPADAIDDDGEISLGGTRAVAAKDLRGRVETLAVKRPLYRASRHGRDPDGAQRFRPVLDRYRPVEFTHRRPDARRAHVRERVEGRRPACRDHFGSRRVVRVVRRHRTWSRQRQGSAARAPASRPRAWTHERWTVCSSAFVPQATSRCSTPIRWRSTRPIT